MIESKLVLGKNATVRDSVNDNSSAKAVGSGSLDVYATPMMVALMERAACLCLADCLESGETSVGTEIKVSHAAASQMGAKVESTATIKRVTGRKIEFTVTASDGAGEIGNGEHTRVIVDAERFVEKVLRRSTGF